MSLEFSIRRAKPILVFPYFALAKRSSGWNPLYIRNEQEDRLFSFTTQAPVIRTLDDIREAVESGEWEIVDEYEGLYTFDEFMAKMNDLDGNELRDPRRRSRVLDDDLVTRDDDGNEWMDGRYV